jgi:hypothetical protein
MFKLTSPKQEMHSLFLTMKATTLISCALAVPIDVLITEASSLSGLDFEVFVKATNESSVKRSGECSTHS